MSDEKQLTVAELLARSGRKAPTGDKSRPRRRRSLEDGGVSVAELTGSIPRVKAKPAEARHSNVPLDQETGDAVQPAAPAKDRSGKPAAGDTVKDTAPDAPAAAKPAAKKPAAEAQSAAAKPAAKKPVAEKPEAAKPAAEAPSADPTSGTAATGTGTGKTPAGKSSVPGTAAATPAAKKPGEQESTTGKPGVAKQPEAVAKPGTTKAQTPAGKSTAAPGGKPGVKNPVAAGDAAAPTGQKGTKPGSPEKKDAELSAADKFAAAKAAAANKSPGKSTTAEKDRKSGPGTPSSPATAAATAATTAAGQSEAEGTPGRDSASPDQKPPSREDTQVISAVAAAEPTRRGPVDTGATAEAQSAAAAVPTSLATGAGTALSADTTGEIPAVGETTSGAGATPVRDGDADEAEEIDETDEGISLAAVIALAVVGIILGVLVFLGFEYLWANFNRVAVGVGALVVTLGLVLGTRLLRTTNDGLSMTLAGAAGMLMSFGPALIMYLT